MSASTVPWSDRTRRALTNGFLLQRNSPAWPPLILKCKFIVPNLFTPPITVQIDGIASIGSWATLMLHVKSRMRRAGSFGQQVELFNWTTNTWDTTDTRTDATNTTFAVRELIWTGTLSRLLRSDGALRARYRIRQTGPSAVLTWCHEVDQSVWILNP